MNKDDFKKTRLLEQLRRYGVEVETDRGPCPIEVRSDGPIQIHHDCWNEGYVIPITITAFNRVTLVDYFVSSTWHDNLGGVFISGTESTFKFGPMSYRRNQLLNEILERKYHMNAGQRFEGYFLGHGYCPIEEDIDNNVGIITIILEDTLGRQCETDLHQVVLRGADIRPKLVFPGLPGNQSKGKRVRRHPGGLRA